MRENMSIDALLQRLDRCKSTTKDQWIARCPAHDDKSPSLSIKANPDGRVLIHCHAGCTPEDVTISIGMTMSDLFPPTDTYSKPAYKPPSDNSELILAIGRADIRNGKRLTPLQKQEMSDACIAIQRGA